MKKILITLLFVMVIFLVGCKKDEPKEEDKGDDYYTPEALAGSHSVNTSNDELNPYIVVKGLPDKDGFINYSVIVFLNFPMRYHDNVLTKRYYNYMQCDYKAKEETTIYYHNFLHSDDDGAHLSNAFKVAPRYLTKDLLTEVLLLIKYEYEVDSKHQEKELLFKETMLEYDESKYQDIVDTNSNFDVVVVKNEDEDYNRYKLIIGLDENIKEGHYDIQTWIECDSGVIPFVGYYHYNAINGSINSVSDEKVDVSNNVSVIYYMVRYYDIMGNITDTYYLKRLN